MGSWDREDERECRQCTSYEKELADLRAELQAERERAEKAEREGQESSKNLCKQLASSVVHNDCALRHLAAERERAEEAEHFLAGSIAVGGKQLAELHAEREAHAATRAELQAECERVDAAETHAGIVEEVKHANDKTHAAEREAHAATRAELALTQKERDDALCGYERFEGLEAECDALKAALGRAVEMLRVAGLIVKTDFLALDAARQPVTDDTQASLSITNAEKRDTTEPQIEYTTRPGYNIGILIPQPGAAGPKVGE